LLSLARVRLAAELQSKAVECQTSKDSTATIVARLIQIEKWRSNILTEKSKISSSIKTFRKEAEEVERRLESLGQLKAGTIDLFLRYDRYPGERMLTERERLARLKEFLLLKKKIESRLEFQESACECFISFLDNWYDKEARPARNEIFKELAAQRRINLLKAAIAATDLCVALMSLQN
jgi:hypothetical protein